MTGFSLRLGPLRSRAELHAKMDSFVEAMLDRSREQFEAGGCPPDQLAVVIESERRRLAVWRIMAEAEMGAELPDDPPSPKADAA